MKKLVLFLTIALTIVSCSTPQDRANIVTDYGTVIFRTAPTSSDTYETFLCVDEENHLWIIRVRDDSSLSDANKIQNYKVILDIPDTTNDKE
jgi:hypothetical protein